VLPVLVADDWAVTPPELPEMAVGTTVTLTSPPWPPLALASAMELPPMTLPVAEPPTAMVVLEREPALPECAVALPPRPPSPPVATMRVSFSAGPVSPERPRETPLPPELPVESASPSDDACRVATHREGHVGGIAALARVGVGVAAVQAVHAQGRRCRGDDRAVRRAGHPVLVGEGDAAAGDRVAHGVAADGDRQDVGVAGGARGGVGAEARAVAPDGSAIGVATDGERHLVGVAAGCGDGGA